MARTALTYKMQGANDFKLITHDKNKFAIARAAKYAMSDAWQAKAYAEGLNAVGYEYRQGLSVFGPLKAMNDALWCVTGFDLFDARRNDESETMRRIQREIDAKVREERQACDKANEERCEAMRVALDAKVAKAVPATTQHNMYYEAERKAAEVSLLFIELVEDGMTREELARNIERRPVLWARFSSWLEKLPSKVEEI